MKVFLIGMMGAGKSYWCRYLAKKLKTGGYDLDFLIESHEEKSISEIFEEDGEDYFRKSEAKILRWFGEKKAFVLATGGGAPCFHDNMDWMNKNGLTIWLDEPIATLVERLKPEKEHRPLIQSLSDEALADFLQNKLIERTPVYEKAQHILRGKEISESSFKKIIQQYA
ncbi:MAG: shikimate kinase [Sediminibacterium sp.]|nr:shikimate kinase [uncultured Sediminibacterium sp.]